MSEIIKKKAKDFMLQLRPKSQILKIGFGEYFYQKRQKISITEEFSSCILRKIENIKIDDKKKTAEFDTLFKGIQTHFVIKEVYEGTLNIMKFIKSYNEKPFQIKSQYKDDISIVIDKDGFNLSLSKPNCENSIRLFDTKKGPCFHISFLEPALRFVMKSCKVTTKGLYIKHDTLDQYSNEITEKSEFNWDFDIQPEMKELIIDLIGKVML